MKPHLRYTVYRDGRLNSTRMEVVARSPRRAAEDWMRAQDEHRVGEIVHVIVVPPGGSFPDKHGDGNCESFYIRVQYVALEHVANLNGDPLPDGRWVAATFGR